MQQLEALAPNGLASLETATYRRVMWRIIPLMVVCFVFGYLDRVNISFAKLQMQADLGFSDAAYGLGASIFFVGYFIFEIPSNLILSRMGARKWIARIMVSWGLASAAMMFVTNETWFYILRFTIGAAEAGFLPGAILYFTYWFPAQRRARITGYFMTSIPLSGVLGGPLAGLIMTNFAGLNSWAGWQWLFLIEGVLTAFVGIAVLFCLTDRPSEAKWLSQDEKRLLQDNLASEASEAGKATVHQFGQALRQPATIFLAIVYMFILMSLYGLTFWMPQLIKNTGIASNEIVGLLSAIPYAAAGIGMVWIGRRSDRTGERRLHLGLAVLAAGIGYVISAAFGTHTGLALAALTLAAGGIMGCLPVFWTLPPKYFRGAAAAGGIALVNSVGNLGGIISPYLVGKVKDLTGDTAPGLYAIAAVTILAAMLILFALPRTLAEQDRAATDA
ncbi:MFS transporter [Bordetella sp. BOR01]|uniref:MFS transporter n=1 Tax=Bordetella sp. BOR01 TaxID=2854779 RepID=UPI001C44428F|nr:MFS transporter [Bordetella sp. BOR01]MBV7484388.1 MFS transporter [Bordetella sp. BOR01]